MSDVEILQKWAAEEREMLWKVLEHVTPEKYRKAADLAFDFLIRRTKEMRESAFDNYRDMALKGIPFSERLGAVDKTKVQWCENELESLKRRRRNYKLKPLYEWLQSHDGATIKALGFVRFMQLHLEEAITSSEEPHEDEARKSKVEAMYERAFLEIDNVLNYERPTK